MDVYRYRICTVSEVVLALVVVHFVQRMCTVKQSRCRMWGKFVDRVTVLE